MYIMRYATSKVEALEMVASYHAAARVERWEIIGENPLY